MVDNADSIEVEKGRINAAIESLKEKIRDGIGDTIKFDGVSYNLSGLNNLLQRCANKLKLGRGRKRG